MNRLYITKKDFWIIKIIEGKIEGKFGRGRPQKLDL